MNRSNRPVELNSALHQRVDAAVSWTKRAVRVLRTDNARTAWALYRRQCDMVFPGRATQGKATACVDVPAGAEMQRFPTIDGQHVAGLFGTALNEDGSPRVDGRACPTILYFYSAEQSLRMTVEVFQTLRHAGLNVLIPEYLGYGLSSGEASEANCYSTASAAYEHLLSRHDIDQSRIVAVGSVLGGAVAIELANRRTLSGVVTLGTFTSLREQIGQNYPDLPMVGLLKHHFDAQQKIAKVDWPVLVIHSVNDAVVPHHMAEALTEAGRKQAVQRIDLHGDTPGQFLVYRDSDALRTICDYSQALSPVMPAREERTDAASVFAVGRAGSFYAARPQERVA